MSLLRGSFGSSSPNARPAICSYCPASPKEAQAAAVPLQKAGDTVSSMTILVMRACDGAEQTRNPAAIATTCHRMMHLLSDGRERRWRRRKVTLYLCAHRLSTFLL